MKESRVKQAKINMKITKAIHKVGILIGQSILDYWSHKYVF